MDGSFFICSSSALILIVLSIFPYIFWVPKGIAPEKAMAPHSSPLAWKMPWMEEPGGLQSMGSLRVGHDWATSLSLFTFMQKEKEKEMATHSSVLAWRIPGTGEPGGLPSQGSHRVGHDWRDLAAAKVLPTFCIIPSGRLQLPLLLANLSVECLLMSCSVLCTDVYFSCYPHTNSEVEKQRHREVC